MTDMGVTTESEGSKRLAVFLDGTTDKSRGNTNVWRARSLCAAKGTDGREQRAYYSVGVGTEMGETLRGEVFGYGIDDQVIDAYEWLVENFSAGDEIFVFGFSRGAFAARSLAGYLSRCGLIEPGSPLGVMELYERYRTGDRAPSIHQLLRAGADRTKLSLQEKWMVRDCRPVPVKFTGVWDTVGSLPLTDNLAFLTGGDHAFLDTNLRKTEEFIYHAVAIDENRKDFDVTLFSRYRPDGEAGAYVSPRSLADVEQRWFSGAHGDVGGGTDSDALAQVPLRWLLSKASGHGLDFKRDVIVDDEAMTAAIEDSFGKFLHGIYALVSLEHHHWRSIGRPPVASGGSMVHNVNETIDRSVFDRWRRDAKYRPENVHDWAARHSVDPAALTTSVQTGDVSSAPD